MESNGETIRQLREEVARSLADALRVDEETQAETGRVKRIHDDEMILARDAHDDETHNLHQALASRDVIGQAKGIIMVTMHCTADHAFALLVEQSQAENRKLTEIATELTNRISRRVQSG